MDPWLPVELVRYSLVEYDSVLVVKGSLVEYVSVVVTYSLVVEDSVLSFCRVPDL